MRFSTHCAAIVVGLIAFAGCQPNPPQPAPTPPTPGSHAITALAAPPPPVQSDVIARLGTKTITKDDLLTPMIQAHGLSFLLHVAQLQLAKDLSAQHGIKVTPDDVKREHDLTLDRMFRESDDELRAKIKEAEDKNDGETAEKLKAQLNMDREPLIDQYLAQQYVQSHQYVSRQEFDIVLEINAHLRKVVEASPEFKKAITDDMLRKAFGAKFGEKAVIRHIQANNLAGLGEARRRLQAGQSFAEVAAAVSTNKMTAPLGGAIRAFTRTDPDIPKAFKDTAFALKPGEVSDNISAEGAFHIILLEKLIAPKVVKFEDEKEKLRAELNDQIIQASVKRLRDQISSQLLANIKIENAELKAQFDRRLEEGKVQKQEAVDQAMKRDRAVTVPPEPENHPDIAVPATGPVSPPAANRPAEKPAAKPAVPANSK